MLKSLILLFFAAFYLNTQAQISSQCFKDFDFYQNIGVEELENCKSNYFVKCVSKSNHLTKVIVMRRNWFDKDTLFYPEAFKIIRLDGSYMYIFPKAKMPLEKKLYGTANDNRFDTLLSKKDTLYFKKAYPNSISLSKYFKLNKDTICIVSFYYKNLHGYSKKNLTFKNISDWGSDQKYADYSIVKLVINNNSMQFVSTDSSEGERLSAPINLNGIIQTEKIPPSLFWMCIIFRFMV
jgi:hypothetical protein